MLALIIDEISMLSAEFFDGIEAVVSKIRDKSPFGGIQLILCGVIPFCGLRSQDFFQLPPVFEKTQSPEEIEERQSRVKSEIIIPKGYCFEGKAWASCNLIQVC